jgi:hypothetical protein
MLLSKMDSRIEVRIGIAQTWSEAKMLRTARLELKTDAAWQLPIPN